jgi:hypothetical protein
MKFIERLFDSLFSILSKALTVTCAIAFVLDKVFDINLIKFF